MAAPVPQSGAIAPCPGCGADTLRKEMIPTGAVDGAVSYLCVTCARRLIATGASGGARSEVAPD